MSKLNGWKIHHMVMLAVVLPLSILIGISDFSIHKGDTLQHIPEHILRMLEFHDLMTKCI